ncbi:MAG: Mth938-like domain-containing protein [Alphaproteobacteria bacterium]|nr:Mth938-like domain-containing protein [Alphaproteobacteria bacterium]MCZ6496515.1 Mth938-like domain-containing protein [Alphaproteobacteria bacterium]MCZ6848667.1 Mth938-like domain-containing protein [Alphaproteobacteria bacterium]
MELTPLKSGDRAMIQAYGDGGFRISGRRFTGAVMVFEDRVLSVELEDIAAADYQPLEEAAVEIEILLLGCGEKAGVLPPEHRARLKGAGISAEVMGTGAACRTFNVLQAEGRRVAALLIAVP